MRAKGLGARVIVTEFDLIKAIAGIILAGKTHMQTRKLAVLSRKLTGSFRDIIRVSVIV